jgi:hypothetical protein
MEKLMKSTFACDIQYNIDRGKHLVATKGYSCGEVILEEPPLLVMPTGAYNTSVERVVCAVSCIAKARPLVKDAILQLYHPDDLSPWADAPLVQTVRQAALQSHDVQQNFAEQAGMIYLLNSHAFPNNASAFFALCSKINHDCEGNSRFTVGADGLGRVVACRQIAAGEEITQNYIGDLVIGSSLFRQSVLQESKLFQCKCIRCRSPDFARRVPCPVCHPRTEDNTIDADVGLEIEEVAYMTFHPEPQGQWFCDTCEKWLSTADVEPALVMMQAFESILPQKYQHCIKNGVLLGQSISEQDCAEDYAGCIASLGAQHWLTVALQLLLCHRYAEDLIQGADSAVEMTRESLMDTLVQIWCWFEVVGLHHYWMRDTLLCCCQALKHTEDDEHYRVAAMYCAFLRPSIIGVDNQQQFDEVIKLVAENMDTVAQLLHNEGNRQLLSGHADTAVLWYEQGIACNTSNADVRRGLHSHHCKACLELQDYFGALQDVHALRSLPATKSGCTALRALLMDVQYTQMEYDAAGTPVPELQALEAQLKELIPL